ncbi:MAG TPA: sulfite exporter TauE/SafE family protein [Blastocatellia bacterium]
MTFLISHQVISPVYLIVLGFVIGVLGGFFGVGGSFLAAPALFAAGVPLNFVVGTDLAHIVGKSIVAAKKHRALGNVDVKLGMIMVVGTIVGVECGAQMIEALKRHAHVDSVVGAVYVVVLVLISVFMAWESWLTIKMRADRKEAALKRGLNPDKVASQKDESALAGISRWVHRINIGPRINLPESGIPKISIWPIILVAFIGGVFSGFLGGGAGYIRMPAMVYLLGIPTHVAVGTDLFEVMISASYGTFTHALKGNVDIMIALVMHTGAAIGAQIGATTTRYFGGPRIRLAFVPLPLIGAVAVLYNLLSGKHTS